MKFDKLTTITSVLSSDNIKISQSFSLVMSQAAAHAFGHFRHRERFFPGEKVLAKYGHGHAFFIATVLEVMGEGNNKADESPS